MKTRFDKIGYPLYCDAGPHEGDMRVDLTIRLYLSPQEYARYEGPESLRITLGEPVASARPAAPLNLPGTGRPATPGSPPAPCPRRPCPASPPLIRRLHREGAQPMAVLESRDYQAARERLKGNPVIAMMAAGVVTVPLAELADEDGTPRSHLMNQANRAFDDAEARNAGNPAYEPYPKDAHRHLGLIAEAVLAERAAMRAAVASAMAAPGTDPESADVTSIIERMRAGEPAVAIARETGAIGEAPARSRCPSPRDGDTRRPENEP